MAIKTEHGAKLWRDGWRDASLLPLSCRGDLFIEAAEVLNIQASEMARPPRLERGTLLKDGQNVQFPEEIRRFPKAVKGCVFRLSAAIAKCWTSEGLMEGSRQPSDFLFRADSLHLYATYGAFLEGLLGLTILAKLQQWCRSRGFGATSA